MGCGASSIPKDDAAPADYGLASHLAATLGIPDTDADVRRYLSVLYAEGYNVPSDFDGVSMDELKKHPFSFKTGHLKKVMLARQKTESIVPERRLASHLSTILGIPQDDPDVERYLAALQAEGYRTTPSFDHLALGELAEKPFNFKAGDLKTIARSRGLPARAATLPAPSPSNNPRQQPQVAELQRAEVVESAPQSTEVGVPVVVSAMHGVPSVRGRCTVCGEDVLDTQPRVRTENGLYQHEACVLRLQPLPDVDPETTLAISPVTPPPATGIQPPAPATSSAESASAPTAKMSKPVLPDGKHVFLSCQADVQDQVNLIVQISFVVPGMRVAETSGETAQGGIGGGPYTLAKSTPMLPDEKHAFLSYQWGVQDQVKEIN
eukprot:gene16217-30314_t